jgi:hydrogenase maturation protease
MSGGVLVAGIGNVLQSDDGFGVEVVQRLLERPVPEGVRVAEFGIRGVHLAYELLDGYDALVLVDAVPLGEAPGTVVVMEPDPIAATDAVIDAHTMGPDVVLSTLARLGGEVARIRVVGCQPATLEEGFGLSAPVAAAVDLAVDLCLELVADIVQPASSSNP